MSTSGPGVPRPFRRVPGGGVLELLDQSRLPGRIRWIRLADADGVASAIRELRVRGAPAIGLAAAHGLLLEAEAGAAGGLGGEEVVARLRAAAELLVGTRPTAVNLQVCVGEVVREVEAWEGGPTGSLVDRIAGTVRALEAEDEAMCRAIGEAGVELIPAEGGVVLTHCNAGALATGGIGTALAPIYVAAERGIPVRVLACETRPVLQGSRLTAWELERAGIPVEVIPDSAAAWMMAAGEVDLVLVGADRIAANGDTANKIGTYALAVLASHHGIPFHVAAPRTTFDSSIPDGLRIVIEERHGDEIRRGMGRLTAPREVAVRNPAFDVTPGHLVRGFVTERGILHPPFGPVAGLRSGGTSTPPQESP